ncbi:MAG: tape measure protein [Acidobacteria bacterium]|nr:tape measure protein [Acidobacteriota bacterium]
MDFKLRYLITADGKQAKAELGEVERSIERLSGRGRGGRSGSGFADVLGGNLAADAITKFSGLLLDGGRAVLDYSAKLEQTKIGFETLMGSAEAAARHIDELRRLSTSSGLEFQSLTKMSQRLQGAGVDAAKVADLIKDIGNTAAATGELTAERMEGIGVAISQILSKGRLSAEEMEQLAERGIPAWRILSQQLGLTVEETRKLSEQGKISGDVMVEAFQKFSRAKFGDAMKRQAETFTGAMNNIKNIVLVTSEQAFQPLFIEISKIATKANKEIQAQKGDFSKMGVTLGTAMGEAFGLALGTAVRVAVLDLLKGMSAWPGEANRSVFFSSLFGLGQGAARGLTDSLPNGTNPTGPGSINFPNYARPNGRRWSDGTRPPGQTAPPGAVSRQSNAEAAQAAAEAARIAQRDLAARFGIEQINNRTIQDQFAKQIEELVGGFDVRDGSNSVFGAMTEAFKLYRENLEASLRELEKLEKEQLDVKATANEIALLEAQQQQRRLELNEEWKKKRDDAIADIQSKEKEAAEERFRIWQMDFEWQLKLYKQAEERLELERKRNEEERQRVLDSIGPAPVRNPMLSAPGTLGGGIAGGLGVDLVSIFSDESLNVMRTGAERMKLIFADVSGFVGEAIGSMAQGLAQMGVAWLTTGEFSAKAALQMVASAAMGIATQAGFKAIFEYAEAAAAAARYDFYAAGMHTAAAKLYLKTAAIAGAVGIGAGLGARALGGGSNSGQGSQQDGFVTSSGSQAPVQPFSRTSDNAFVSGRSGLSQAVSELSAEVRGLRDHIGGMSPGDVLVAGSRQKRGFIGYQVARDIRNNAATGVTILKNAGFN